MGNSHIISNRVFNEALASGQPFTKHSLAEETIQRGGILRIGICYTFGEYLEDLQKNGLIRFSGYNKEGDATYQAVESFSNLINAHPRAILQGFKADALIPLVRLSAMLKIATELPPAS